MKRKVVATLFAAVLGASMIAGCGSSASTDTAESAAESEAQDEASAEAETEEVSAEAETEEVDDAAAAAEVDELIAAIQVQEWTEDTTEQCEAAKAAWDALTDEQKELVEEYDYFGLDTGDASADDPLNQDEIGENEILVVSFGTSFNDSRAKDIGAVENAIAEANPDWSVRRAFTAQIIINHVLARDGEEIDNVDQALARAVDNGVKNLIIQPTHLMHGAEYDELMEAVDEYSSSFETVTVAEPLLGEVGDDATVVNADKQAVAEYVVAEAMSVAGYADAAAAAEDGTALVLMGHGTSHEANISYTQMQSQMADLGYDNVFIGTVEGEPEGTDAESVIQAVSDAGYTKVILRPLMVVAGDHANNDMAGSDDDSWLSMFEASGSFESVDCQIEGLGRIADIEQIYVDHTAAAIAESGVSVEAAEAASASSGELADGEYQVAVSTDSTMFHLNETLDGMGTLTVKNGQMSVHISLPSKNIVNLYMGKAADAEKADNSELLQPTEDEVTYSDGITETVYGFDIPVEALDTDFDVAIIGTHGNWYDHVVCVSSPE